MRITNTMMANSYMRDMRKNLGNMNKLNQQLTSGKEIRRPSDNPFKVARSMQLHSDINANKQYNNNIVDTINFLDATDTALNQLTNVMQRTRELMVSSGNATYGDDEKKALSNEINQQMEQIAQILNTNFDGKYIFGGTQGTNKPVGVQGGELTFINLKGDKVDIQDPNNKDANKLKGDLVVEISQGVKVDYNITAIEILEFKDDYGKDVSFTGLINNIKGNINGNNINEVISANLKDMDSVVSNLMKIRGEVGALQNRMDAAKDKNEDENLNMTEVLSNTEDIDFTEKTMQVSIAETVYIAALQTSGKILPPTLMDYLR